MRCPDAETGIWTLAELWSTGPDSTDSSEENQEKEKKEG